MSTKMKTEILKNQLQNFELAFFVTNQSNKTLDQIVHPLRGTSDCTHNWFCYNTQSPTANST